MTIYRRILLEEFEERNCFYCGKELKHGDIHVDHFIPWSFIKDDSLWNLVLSCQQCNLKKSDKLTPNIFVDNLIQRNHVILEKNSDRISKSYKDQKLRFIYYWAKCNYKSYSLYITFYIFISCVYIRILVQNPTYKYESSINIEYGDSFNTNLLTCIKSKLILYNILFILSKQYRLSSYYTIDDI